MGLEELKARYQSVLNEAEKLQIQLQNVHMVDDKLYIKGIAPSEDAKNKIWDQIKLVNPNADDITGDFTVDESRAAAATAGGGSTETYTVQSGDTLSKIAARFYGDANQYMKIYEANRDKLSAPDRISAGQELRIPS